MAQAAASAAPADDPDAHQWEYYERGVWYAMPRETNAFLERQYLVGMHITNFPFGLPPYTAKYKYNLRTLLQQRMHYLPEGAWEGHGRWTTVKTRSIRRIRLMDAPVSPRG